jgi:hypothetical protein
MAYEDRHDVRFLNCFPNNPEGHALYLPVSGNDLKPGACGYFDQDGNWQTIAHLTDTNAPTNTNAPTGTNAPAVNKWTKATGIDLKPNTLAELWPVVQSESMNCLNLGADGNVV